MENPRKLPDRTRRPMERRRESQIAEQVGRFVRERRRANCLEQAALAELAGVGRRFLSELEAGKPTVSVDAVEEVLKVFGKTLAVADLPSARDVDKGVHGEEG